MTTMEAKKAQPVASKAESAPITAGRVVDFVGDVKTELKKISWTSPDELRVYTKIVVAMTFFLGMSIYVIDLFIQGFLTGLSHIFGFFG